MFLQNNYRLRLFKGDVGIILKDADEKINCGMKKILSISKQIQ
jgi:ATP-dependent exoDNAse (exonuclease V) alpha subunit